MWDKLSEDEWEQPIDMEIFRRWRIPVGLVLFGLLFVVVGKVISVDLLAVLGAISALVGIVVGSRIAYVSSSERVPVPDPSLSTVPVSDAERRERFQNHLSAEVVRTRGRIESVLPYSAVVVTGRPVNHVLHLLASVFLCGLWIPVWFVIAARGGEKRWVLSVDPCANVKWS